MYPYQLFPMWKINLRWRTVTYIQKRTLKNNIHILDPSSLEFKIENEKGKKEKSLMQNFKKYQTSIMQIKIFYSIGFYVLRK